MEYKAGLVLFITLLIGTCAFPILEDDMSIFFDHTDAGARIVGGTQAVPGNHPHMVALIFGKRAKYFLCGGSLITQRSVLTAAHCIDVIYFRNQETFKTLRVTVGSYQYKSGIVYDVAGNVSHPSYDNINVKHDISILITTTNVALNDLVQLVPITYDYIGSGVQAVFAGWGVYSTDGTESHELMEMRTSTIDGADCMIRVARATLVLQMPYYVPPLDPHVEVCTLQPTGLGICGGDSGSALRRASDGHQFGIASWAFHCALGAPDMYIRISSYQNWLRSVII